LGILPRPENEEDDPMVGPVRSSDKVAKARTLQWINQKAFDRGFTAFLPEEVFHEIDWDAEHRCEWVQYSPGAGPPHVLTGWRIRLAHPATVAPPPIEGALDSLLDPMSTDPPGEVVRSVEGELCIEQADYDALPSSAISPSDSLSGSRKESKHRNE
jgi:hypothetical protein